MAELTPFVVWALSGGRFPLALCVLQILCLDLLTDQLPALALGIEPPRPHVLEQAPYRGHIVDRRLLIRAFLILGLLESLVELAAFWLSLRASGWHYGEVPSPSVLALASGAAFVAIVAGQSATALACRSNHLAGYAIPLRTNPRLVVALLTTWSMTAGLVLIPGSGARARTSSTDGYRAARGLACIPSASARRRDSQDLAQTANADERALPEFESGLGPPAIASAHGCAPLGEAANLETRLLEPTAYQQCQCATSLGSFCH